MMNNDDLLRRVEALEQEVKDFKEEERQRELRRLRWGIGALGGIVMMLGGWAWSQVSQYVTLTIGPR